MSPLNSLYQEAIRQHAAHPVGYCRQIKATHQNECYNPQCGDRILVQLQVVNGKVEAAAFEGEACAICMASASMLCEMVPGQPVTCIEEWHRNLIAALEGSHVLDGLDTLEPLLGVKPYPSRIRCATLPWSAASGAV